MFRKFSFSPVIRSTRVILKLAARTPDLAIPETSGIQDAVDRGIHNRHRNKNIVMIVLNDIEHDGRVLKVARTLQKNAFQVTLLGMNRAPGGRGYATIIGGMPAIILPNPLANLINVKLPALKWDFTIAYMKAAMWCYVELLSPRYIHTHDYHAIPIGRDFTLRLRRNGHTVHWMHDFHEWVPGYDYMDEEWRSNVLEQERRGVPLMDFRLTVSPDISRLLTNTYMLETPPTVVLNVPASSLDSSTVGKTVRTTLKLNRDEILIVYSGGVSEPRGIHTVVEALAHDRRWHLALVTSDKNKYTESLMTIAKQGNYEDRVHFLPYVKPHEVSAFVRDATLGILPFRRYGNSDVSLPNKLFDYLHAGLPMVASNCTLIEQFISQHSLGEIFTAGNVNECVEKLGIVISHRQELTDHIRGSEELLRACSWETEEKKLLSAYRRLAQFDDASAARHV